MDALDRYRRTQAQGLTSRYTDMADEVPEAAQPRPMASTSRGWMFWAVPMMATCVVLAIVLPLTLGGSGASTTPTAHRATVNQPGVLSDADVPALLRLSESSRAVSLAADAFGQVPQGCGKPVTHAFVSPGSADWVFSPAQLPEGALIISTASACRSPQIAEGAFADYNLTAALWTSAAQYNTGDSSASTWGPEVASPSTSTWAPVVANPSTHLPALGQSAQLFTYSAGGMSELAVWWVHALSVEQLILIGPESQPDISRATLVSLALKMDES
jgi:hypothetical protein